MPMWTLGATGPIERIPGCIDLGGRDPKWGDHERDVEWFTGKGRENFTNSFHACPAAMHAKGNVGAQLRGSLQVGE